METFFVVVSLSLIIGYLLYALNCWVDKVELERKYLQGLLEEKEQKDGYFRKI